MTDSNYYCTLCGEPIEGSSDLCTPHDSLIDHFAFDKEYGTTRHMIVDITDPDSRRALASMLKARPGEEPPQPSVHERRQRLFAANARARDAAIDPSAMNPGIHRRIFFRSELERAQLSQARVPWLRFVG